MTFQSLCFCVLPSKSKIELRSGITSATSIVAEIIVVASCSRTIMYTLEMNAERCVGFVAPMDSCTFKGSVCLRYMMAAPVHIRRVTPTILLRELIWCYVQRYASPLYKWQGELR